MGVPYHHACRFHGKPVVAHARDGRIVFGMVRRVTPHEIWLEVMHSRVRPISDKGQVPEIIVADQKEKPEIDIVPTSFTPFFRRDAIIALVLFDLLAISLFVW